jgi:hypothetical protein
VVAASIARRVPLPEPKAERVAEYCCYSFLKLRYQHMVTPRWITVLTGPTLRASDLETFFKPLRGLIRGGVGVRCCRLVACAAASAVPVLLHPNIYVASADGQYQAERGLSGRSRPTQAWVTVRVGPKSISRGRFSSLPYFNLCSFNTLTLRSLSEERMGFGSVAAWALRSGALFAV